MVLVFGSILCILFHSLTNFPFVTIYSASFLLSNQMTLNRLFQVIRVVEEGRRYKNTPASPSSSSSPLMPNKEITTKWEFDLQSKVSFHKSLDVYVTLKHSWTQDTFQAKQKEICLEDAQDLMFSYHIQSKLSFFLWWWKHYLNLITLLVRFFANFFL